MKTDLFTLKQQAQEFILRLFIESSVGSFSSTPSDSFYTCAHCGTSSRIRA
jgi:hypothetical protein